MKIKVVYIVSDIDKSLAFEWVASYLDKEKFDLIFVLLNEGNSTLEDYLIEHKIPTIRIEVNSKIDFLMAYIRLASFLWKEKPDVIHCHLRKAELIGIPVAFLTRIKRRIYTRHFSTYHHLYHPKGVYIDKFISRLATDVVAISNNVRTVLAEWEGVKKENICLIPHGFDLDLFKEVPESQVAYLKRKYGVEGPCIVIGIIARYTWLKGYAYSIPAIGRLMKDNPGILLVIANANGNDKKAIKELIQEHIPKGRVREILFEPNLPALYKSFDYFVHVPFNATAEAFGQTYVEAQAAGVPSVFTLSGIAVEFIEHRKNALVVNYKSADDIYMSLRELIENPALGRNLAVNGVKDVKRRFSIKAMIDKLQGLYAAGENYQ